MKNEQQNVNNPQFIMISPADSAVYKRNIEALYECYPEYAEKIERVEIKKRYRPVLTGSAQRFNIYSLDKNLFYYDQEDPIEDARKQIEILNLKNARVAVFLGFGLGFIVDYYAKFISDKQKTQFMIIIESDLELFKTALSFIDYSPMIRNTNIKLMLGEELANIFVILEQYLRDIRLINLLKCIKPVYHESAFKLDNDYYMGVLKQITDSVIYMRQFFGNNPHDSLIGVENMLDNIGEIVENPGINLLYNQFKGKPAVIVSTGPSLNKNKHLLKGLEDKALILCPDASLRILLDMGVKPHLVTSLERIPETATLMSGFKKEEVEDVYYAATPVIPNKAYQVYPGPRIIVYRNFDHFKWLGIDRGILEIKHSSGNMAFKIADALGCDPIILIGQDLAFSREGRTHASGTMFGENQEKTNAHAYVNKFEVMGNDGQPILTMDAWDTFRKAYEVDIAAYKGTCINSTEGGAFINGTVIMPLKEAIDKYINETFNPLEKIKDLLLQFTKSDMNNDIEKIVPLIDSTLNDLENMASFCMEGLEEIKESREYFDSIINNEESNIEDLKEKLKPILEYKKKVLETMPTMQLFLMHIVQSYHISFEIDLYALWERYDTEAQALAKTAVEHMKWFAIIHDIIKICIGSLNKARDRVTEIEFENQRDR